LSAARSLYPDVTEMNYDDELDFGLEDFFEEDVLSFMGSACLLVCLQPALLCWSAPGGF